MDDIMDRLENIRDLGEGYYSGIAVDALARIKELEAETLRWQEQVRDLWKENQRLREALTRLRDCDWVISLPDRMDAVRDVARDALGGGE